MHDPATVIRPDALADPLSSRPASSRGRPRERIAFLAGAHCALLFLLACSGDADGRSGSGARWKRRSSAGAIELTSAPYRETSLTQVGSIVGFVAIDGDIPADSVVLTTVDQKVCGASIADSSIVHSGDSLANVVVWLSDVREGKPLPVERRTEIVNVGCRFEPRVQAVVAGTTVNVRNDDHLAHITRFSTAGASDTLARTPLTDDGQVVPNEHIAARSGLVAATCERHPWTRGYIAVFESPYFAVTDVRGSFRFDSVPPGKYRLVAWHERAARQVQRVVEIGAAAESRIELKLRLE